MFGHIQNIFSPGKPIANVDLLVGRSKQLNKIRLLLKRRGRTPIITGARGIGKTSLANIAAIQIGQHIDTSCHAETTFGDWATDLLSNFNSDIDVIEKSTEKIAGITIADKILSIIGLELKSTSKKKIMGLANARITPNILFKVLRKVRRNTVITIDEFDRIPRQDTKSIELFGDFVKLLGDKSKQHKIHLIIIGVSPSAHRLLNGHLSVKRNATPIHLKRLTQKSIQEYFDYVERNSKYKFTEDVVLAFKKDFKGFPHFIHIVGEYSLNYISKNESVSLNQYNKAVNEALDELLGIDSKWDLIRNKNSAEGDAILKELISSDHASISLNQVIENLSSADLNIQNFRAARSHLKDNEIIVVRGEYIRLSDPEMLPFLCANYSRSRYVARHDDNKQLKLPLNPSNN